MSRRVCVRFEGRVQGVGFRFGVLELARGFPVRGYVQNMVDGDVQVVAEGQEDDILRFLDSVRISRLSRYVVREQTSWSCSTGEFASFDIRYA
jgi:acylphosphatase